MDPVDGERAEAMSRSGDPSRLPRSPGRTARLVLGLLMAAGMVGGIIRVVVAALSGHGGESFRDGWGVRWTYSGVAVFMVLGVLALAVVVAVIAWRAGREERDFVRKYGKGK